MDEQSRRSASPESLDTASSFTSNARSLNRSQTIKYDQLTRHSNSSLPVSSHSQAEPHPSRTVGLNFPTLGSDGSVESLTSHSTRTYQRTPPAALSTLGAKAMMQGHTNLSESTSSLSDSHYDMIDDLSEISNDDHETASLASNDGDHTFDEESETEIEVRDDLVIPSPDREISSVPTDYFVNIPSKRTVEADGDAQRKHEIKMENALLDSYMSEDLETPRQSTLSYNLAKNVEGMSMSDVPAKGKSTVEPTNTKAETRTWFKNLAQKPLSSACLATLVVSLPYILLFALRFSVQSQSVDLMGRRHSLTDVLGDKFRVTGSERALDVEHLLPQISANCTSIDIFGRHMIKPTCEQNARYQAMSPNHMIVALPGNGRFPQLVSTDVVRSDGRRIEFNRTELIEGVHAITVDLQEAYGIVTAKLIFKKPAMEVNAVHNYGSRMLQRKTYENAGTDVTNAVGKEVSVMKYAAKNLTDKMSTELRSGYRATKSVTTDLALAMSRDIQIFANTAFSVLGKAANASNSTAKALSKDMILIQKDLIKFTKDFSASFTSAVNQVKKDTKTALRNPLERSRERLLNLGQAVSCMTAKDKSDCKTRRAHWRQKAKAVTKNCKSRSFNKMPLSDQGAASQPSRQVQRQITHGMQQLDRVYRLLKRKEEEFRTSGDRAIRKDIRRLKKEQKKRENSLKKLMGKQKSE